MLPTRRFCFTRFNFCKDGAQRGADVFSKLFSNINQTIFLSFMKAKSLQSNKKKRIFYQQIESGILKIITRLLMEMRTLNLFFVCANDEKGKQYLGHLIER